MFKKTSSPSCTACCVVQWMTMIFLTIASIASLAGVWVTHVKDSGLSFGTSVASLSLIAFVLTVTCWGKAFLCGCSCGSKGKK